MQLAWNSPLRNARGLAVVSTAGLSLCLAALAARQPLTAEFKSALGQFFAIAAATLVSEDLTTINAGVLIAQGRIGAPLGLLACFFGIFIGDVLLFLAGRYLGRAVVQRAPLKWLLTPAAVERSSAWLQQRMRLATWRGRRALVGWWRRWSRWEFWPPYVFYPPVLLYLLWLSVRQRSLTLFTAVNPAIPASGFVGESKAAILDGLRDTGEWVARYELLPMEAGLVERVARAQRFMQRHSLTFPVVLKPDVGQRGSGVRVVRAEEELVAYLRAANEAVIIQEYVAGEEFGVFYYRLPSETVGHIFSITHKTFPVVIGDGKQTVEELILNDARAVALAHYYCAQHADKLNTVLPSGERLQLVELGTHSRGSIFLDGARFATPALAAATDRLSQRFDGFYFGRYDLRVNSLEAFTRGEDFKVLELNGVTAEATHIYDPQHSLLTAYRTLFVQWRIAFEIGAQQRARGVARTSAGELGRLCYRELLGRRR